MIQFEQLRLELLGLDEGLRELREAIGYTHMQKEVESLEIKSAEPDFWEDMENSQKILKRSSMLKSKMSQYDSLYTMFEDTLTLIELADEAEDLSLYDEAAEGVKSVTQSLETQKLSTLLTGEYDSKNAILTFHAGAGGTEAQDWVSMILRMYTHWAEGHGYSVKMLDFLDGEEAGLKSASILITGTNAYGFLRGENGVHRLVRISPFDSSGRRHTSFASLEVMPEIDDDTAVEINPDDLKTDTYRSGGAGGQHVNKTESAVRITHIPTGIIVACQNERSQHQNREVCMKMLKSKLIQVKERAHLDKIEDIKGVQMEIGWGSQIRSYVFMPYTLAKDHRTNFEIGNINAVMDGEIDGFINAYLKAQSLGTLLELTE